MKLSYILKVGILFFTICIVFSCNNDDEIAREKEMNQNQEPDEDPPIITEPDELIEALVINEVYTWGDDQNIDDLDFIEFYNNTDASIDISGYKLWDAGGRERAFTIPNGTEIATNDFLVIECDKALLHNQPDQYPSWGLSKNAGEYVVIADENLMIIDSIEIPSLREFEGYGRSSDAAKDWVFFAKHTKDATNEGPLREPVTNTFGLHINEVFTNNQDTQTQDWNDTRDFIELYNSSDSPLNISGYTMNDDADKKKRLFTFQDGTIIQPKGFLVIDVYKEDPQPENVPVFGLSRSGESVYIWNTSEELVTEITTPSFEDNQIQSAGLNVDGGSNVVYMNVTKGSSNN